MNIFGPEMMQSARIAHENAKNHGFWDQPKEFGTTIALIVGEASEAHDEHRDGRGPLETYYKCPNHGNLDADKVSPQQDDGTFLCPACWEIVKPEGIPTEMADIIIRVLDYVGWAGIDIVTAGNNKHAYNVTRPYMHGKIV